MTPISKEANDAYMSVLRFLNKVAAVEIIFLLLLAITSSILISVLTSLGVSLKPYFVYLGAITLFGSSSLLTTVFLALVIRFKAG